ncbi:MAG: hypothetical protein KF819_07215 [Labilithrix sp.]|nr:hypothetical protein [Labilithrix sp.]
MGAERLVASLFVLAAAACSRNTAAPPPEDARASLRGPSGAPHFQMFRAMPASERAGVVARFRSKNGAGWSVTLGAGDAPDDVDPLFGVVRRARREDPPGPPVELDEETAVAEGVAFLTRNAEFFGFSAGDVATFDIAAGPARTHTFGAWVVRVRGRLATRGYEGFAAVTSMIDILVYLGEDGRSRYFVNVSRVHPRLTLDTTPRLGPDDPRILQHVVGRELIVAIDDPRHPNARVRELRRISLGKVEGGDVKSTRLTIHVSPGPRAVYVTYRLAYAVDVIKERQRYRFVVDADTGDLLEDAIVPVVPEDRDDALAP